MKFIPLATAGMFALIAIAVLPLLSTGAEAAKCQAIGSRVVNSAGFGSGGNTVTDTASIELKKEGKRVGFADKNVKVCSDIFGVTSQLPFVFEWAASCNINNFHECHGAYSSQTHIKGNKPTSKVNFYGLGESVISTCTIDFDC